jgi:hypothetical protein
MAERTYMNLNEEQTETVLRWACFRATELFSGPGLHVEGKNAAADVAARLLERREESAWALALVAELSGDGIRSRETGWYLAVKLAPMWIERYQSTHGELAVKRKMGATDISKKRLREKLDLAVAAVEIRAIAGDFWESVASKETTIEQRSPRVDMSPEEERAAIVAYTGLWQLLEIDPGLETPACRTARLELRGSLDAVDAGVQKEAGHDA